MLGGLYFLGSGSRIDDLNESLAPASAPASGMMSAMFSHADGKDDVLDVGVMAARCCEGPLNMMPVVRHMAHQMTMIVRDASSLARPLPSRNPDSWYKGHNFTHINLAQLRPSVVNSFCLRLVTCTDSIIVVTIRMSISDHTDNHATITTLFPQLCYCQGNSESRLSESADHLSEDISSHA